MLMEPWDGPAALVFTDGTLVGATLDRNGLRPGRYLVTDDGLVVLAQRDRRARLAPERIVRKGRLRPGKMFLVDTAAGPPHRGRRDQGRARRIRAMGRWLDEGRIALKDLPEREHIVHTPGVGHPPPAHLRLHRGGSAHPHHADGARTAQSRSARWDPTRPIAVLSDRPRLLFDYFTQQFAQVTNPPLDSIREEVVTSMKLGLGPERNLLTAGPEHARQVTLDFPVIDNDELAKIQHIEPGGAPLTSRSAACTASTRARRRMEKRLAKMCEEVDEAIEGGAEFIVLSDRDSNKDLAPIPSLLMLATVHHHLIREQNRMKCGIIVEAGDVARGAPRRAADRVRRVGDQPVPRHGDRRRARPQRHDHGHHAPRRPSRT